MRAAVILTVLASCGSRTDLALESPGDASAVSVDANASVDAGHFDAPVDEGAPEVGAEASTCGLDVTGCSVNSEQIGLDGSKLGCKFSVTWICNGQTFMTGGFCAPPGDGNGGGTYEVGCQGSGVICYRSGQTSTCPCAENDATAAFAASICRINQR